MISIFDPVSQAVQRDGSYHLLSYKDQEQSKNSSTNSAAVKSCTNYKKQHQNCDHSEKTKTLILPYLSGAFPDTLK